VNTINRLHKSLQYFDLYASSRNLNGIPIGHSQNIKKIQLTNVYDKNKINKIFYYNQSQVADKRSPLGNDLYMTHVSRKHFGYTINVNRPKYTMSG